jgi:O-antigen/teichoic acid export membrane protein
LSEPNPDLEAHRDERDRRLTRNITVGIGARAASALVALVAVPLLLRVLGVERYGIYVTITAVMGWIQLGVLGFGKGLVNTLVAAQVSGDEALARSHVWSFWVGLAGLVATLAVALAAVFPFVPWAAVFGLPAGVGQGEIETTVAVAAGFTLLALALSPVGFVFTAYQEERVGAVWLAIRNLATLPALAAVWALGGGMPAVAIAAGAAALVVNLASLAWLLGAHRPDLRPRRGDVQRAHLVRALGASLMFFALDLATVLAYQTDKLLILQFAGSTSVARFEMASLVFLLAQSVFGVFLLPAWPALGEALGRGDHPWARRLLRRFSRGTAAGLGAVIALAVAVGPPAIRWWAGHPDVVPDRAVILLVGLFFLARSWTECHSIVLYSLDRQRDLILPTLANGVAFVLLAVVLGRSFGLLGVVVANVAAFAGTQALLVPWLVRRRLGTG